MKACFVSFPAADYAAGRHFYGDLLGLALLREHDGPPHRFTNYALGGLTLKLFEWTEPWFGSGHSGLFIETGDLDAVHRRLVAAGTKVTPIEVHGWGGRCCSVTDPFGNLFSLIDARQKGNA